MSYNRVGETYPRLCEERSDAAVQDRGFGLLRYARKDKRATLAKTKELRSQRRKGCARKDERATLTKKVHKRP